MNHKFIINGIPLAKTRPRMSVFNNIPKVYDNQVKEKKRIKTQLLLDTLEINKNLGESIFPIQGAVAIFFTFCLPIPPSDSKKKANLKANGFIPHTTKPDIDNLEKLALDCCSEILFVDDRFVTSCSSHKKYSLNPHTLIEIHKLESLSYKISSTA